MAVHGWSLLAIMYRMTGEFEHASECVKSLERVSRKMRPDDRWLAWAATFSVTVAGGERGMTPPFPPNSSPDPVTAMAALVVSAELSIAGRADEAVSGFELDPRPDLGPIGDLGRVFYAIALVLSGRGSEAFPLVERSMRAALALDALPVLAAAKALRAEITGELTGLPPPPAEAHSVSDLLVLRAHAGSGTPEAAPGAVAALRQGIESLAMPGMAAGIPDL